MIVGFFSKMMDGASEWHQLLFETLWAYQTSKRTSTGTTPYALAYGYIIVLSIEIMVQSHHVVYQCGLIVDNYTEAIMEELQYLDEIRLGTLDRLVT